MPVELSRPLVPEASWRDYVELCKPKVVLLMLLCALVGVCLASPGAPSPELLVPALLGIALMAASAAVVNHIADMEIDARMQRTRRRPVPTGRVTVAQGLSFSAVMGISGFAVLFLMVNPLTAWLNVGSWVGYALVYTLYLKRATPQNIVIGGLFGAAPPLFGWTAVTNAIEPGGVLLMFIIFVWTPPHFWALALDRKDDYAAAGVPMLPITHGAETTRRHVFAYTVVLVFVSTLPYFTDVSGVLYLGSALVLGGIFLYRAGELLRNRTPAAPMATFRYSIVYLLLLFAALLVDHYTPIDSLPGS